MYLCLLGAVDAVMSNPNTPLGINGLFPSFWGRGWQTVCSYQPLWLLPQIKRLLARSHALFWGSPHLMTD